MTPRDIAALTVRLLGVVTLAQSIPYMLSLLLSREFSMNPAMVAIPVTLTLIGVVFIAAARTISSWIARDATYAATSPQPLTFREWQTLFFSVIGLLIFSRGIPELFGGLFPLFDQADFRHTALTGAVQSVVGAAIFFQARGLANLWRYVQQSRSMREPG